MLEAVLGDSQSKVEVGVSEVEKMNEAGVAAFIGCFQSPVGIAASQAAAKYNTPFIIDVGASDLIVNRGLKNVFRLKPGFGRCADDAIVALGEINKACRFAGQERSRSCTRAASSGLARRSFLPASCPASASRQRS